MYECLPTFNHTFTWHVGKCTSPMENVGKDYTQKPDTFKTCHFFKGAHQFGYISFPLTLDHGKYSIHGIWFNYMEYHVYHGFSYTIHGKYTWHPGFNVLGKEIIPWANMPVRQTLDRRLQRLLAFRSFGGLNFVKQHRRKRSDSNGDRIPPGIYIILRLGLSQGNLSKVVSTHRTGTHPEQPVPTGCKGNPFIVGYGDCLGCAPGVCDCLGVVFHQPPIRKIGVKSKWVGIFPQIFGVKIPKNIWVATT